MKSKLISTAVMGLSAFAVGKAVELAWKIATGNNPPSAEEGDSTTRLLAFAIVSAAAVTVAQRFAAQKTNQFIEARGL